MNAIPLTAELEAHIAASIEESWPAFAIEHPALARAIDQASLGHQVSRSLADDPDFIAAYNAAREANVAAQSLACLVDQFVAPLLRRLL
jgi:hypothetical protein